MNAANAFLIAGLGNPGAEYANTRHNLGFRVLDIFASRHKIEFNHKHKLYWAGSGRIGSHDIILLKPRTFMNLSGSAVASVCTKYGLKPQQVIVVSDDFCLPLGRLRIRKSGGAGGHNGLKDIIACLGSQDFMRLRLGLGSAPADSDPVNFVLESFKPDEYETVNTLLDTAADALSYLIECGPDAAMNKFNA